MPQHHTSNRTKYLLGLGLALSVLSIVIKPTSRGSGLGPPKPASAQTSIYVITDLNPSASPHGINNSGQVVGSLVASSPDYHAIIYGGGLIQDPIEGDRIA